MKKSLLILFGAMLLLFGSASNAATETETVSKGIFQSLKDAIIRDVESTVQSTVTSAATRAMNTVKIAQYKRELEQKKQELKDVEESRINFIVKFFKKRRINREIRDLEEKIKELERQ